MIKENQKRLNRLHVLLDALVIFISYLIAYLIMYYNDDAILALSAQVYFSALIIIIPLFLILYEFFELYTPKRISGRRSEIANISRANTIGVLIVTLALYLGGKNMNMHHFSRRLVIIFYILTNVLMVFERGFIRAETISYDILMECNGSLAAAREKGFIRAEGKEYIVKDGDVMNFLFNV